MVKFFPQLMIVAALSYVALLEPTGFGARACCILIAGVLVSWMAADV